MSKAWEKAEKGAAARQFLIRRGWPAAAVAALPEDAIGLDTSQEKKRLLLPLRVDDEVVDVTALGDERVPKRRTKSRRMPILGSLSDALVHGSSGEPVFIAVRPDDYLLAQCIVAQRKSQMVDHGVALGVPAIGALPDLMAELGQEAKGFSPGTFKLWPVRPASPWLSNDGLVPVSAFRRTMNELKDELIQALNWARVRMPSKAVPIRDLIDPTACWAEWETSRLLIDVGRKDGKPFEWRRTMHFRGMTDMSLLKAYTYRLPLATLVRATFWQNHPKYGEMRAQRPICNEYDLGDLVASWLRTHGVKTWKDSKNQEWAYWDRRLLNISGADRSDFEAKLSEMAQVSLETRYGRAIVRQIKARARVNGRWEIRSARDVHCWSWSDVIGNTPTTMMALGDKADRVAVARPGRVTIEQNADSAVLQLPPHPVEWQPVTGAEWSRLLYDKMGRWLTCEPAMRVLEVAWVLMALLGRRLSTFAPQRPILWPIGPAASGKTHLAQMAQALLYAEREPEADSTPASMTQDAEHQPVFVLDNAEQSMRTDKMVRLLLLAFLGGKRRKFAPNNDKTIRQQIDSWFMLTSIEGGGIHELINRSLFVRHDVVEFGDAEHDLHDPPEEIIEARGALLSGAMTVWAERILPRLVSGEGNELVQAYRESHRLHPLARQFKTLASLAVIADVLVDLDPRWTYGGAAALDRWLAVLGESTSEMLASVDPVGGALRVLLADFNNTDMGPIGPWQPLVETERVPVRPVFARERGGVTLHAPWAKKRRGRTGTEPRWPIVIGFMGAYADLHTTLYERTRVRGVGYVERIPTADILMRRMRHTDHWRTFGKVSRDGRTGSWLHAWILDEDGTLTDAHGEELRKDLARAPAAKDDLGWHGTPAGQPEGEPGKAGFKRVRRPS